MVSNLQCSQGILDGKWNSLLPKFPLLLAGTQLIAMIQFFHGRWFTFVVSSRWSFLDDFAQ
jgi:hypothetical protein